MGWFWADTEVASPVLTHERPSGGCPVNHKAPSALPASTGQCPVDHSNMKINPLNKMPHLPQSPISDAQAVVLPVDREMSTIPKSKDGARWEYPSAQQLYNAMVRKGYSQSGEHVESMLSVHNFLNEGAWQEILDWESKAAPDSQPSLMRFTGMPNKLSPKAFFYSRFMGGQEPFDRHDWFVDRHGKEIRYVIDYYEAPNDEHGEPVFFLDIRPALDSPVAAYDRISRWTSETWKKASGRS